MKIKGEAELAKARNIRKVSRNPKNRKKSLLSLDDKKKNPKNRRKTINRIKPSFKKKTKNSKSVLEKKIKGYASDAAGLRFEQDVITYYAKRGWKCTPRVKKFRREFDIVGLKTDFLDEEILVIECKNKQRVTAGDVLSFIAKVDIFTRNTDNNVQAIIAYTGELPRDAERAAKSAKVKIKFKRF